jgi:2-polyprenyl-3-methyl-5-hydroxy-6-metoxy-1,4-benzoquinol methylase
MRIVESDEIERLRKELVDVHGPWTAYNIELGSGVTTLGRREFAAPEKNIARVSRIVADLARKPWSALRVLDLGAYEGGFSLEMASQGASVVAVEARDAHVAKIQFAADLLDLDARLKVIHADVRDLDLEKLGDFDVVLCLGLLYHLEAPACFELVEAVAAVCRHLAVFETQIALRPRTRVSFRDNEYWGMTYAEDSNSPGAAISDSPSFWMTRASLLNLLRESGFSTITELVWPIVEETAPFDDHLTLVVTRGEPAPLAVVAGPKEYSPVGWRWPERRTGTAHPAQGRLGRLGGRWRAASLKSIFRLPGS